MRPLRALLIYLAFVFLGGALIAPWLWHFMQLFAHPFPKIAAAPFHRYLDRSFLILALIGIWSLMRAFGATSAKEVGIVPPYGGQIKKLFGGIALGIISLAVVAGIEIVCGARSFNSNATAYQIVAAIFSALLAAIVVGTLEEILFRGAVFGGLRRVFGWPIALIVSSLIFALMHFQRADIAGPVNWNSGFILLPKLFDVSIPAYFSLTLVGVILALAYQRTGNLYFSIGLHGGWIFVLQSFSKLTIQSTGANASFWGSSKIVDGWLAFFVLLATLIVFLFLPLQKRLPYTISR